MHPGVSGPQMAGERNGPKQDEVCDGSSGSDSDRDFVGWSGSWQGWLVSNGNEMPVKQQNLNS